jgi:uncharacterized protein (TIGR03437 family)
LRVITLLLAAALPALPQAPVLSAVVSAADNSDAGLGLAPGSLFTIYGQNLADGTRVRIHTASAELEASPLYISATQINAAVPAAAPLGTVEISVATAAGESRRVAVPIVATRFTAFTVAGRPFGPARILQRSGAEFRANRLLDPSHTGQEILIWGTGLGGLLRGDVTVSIGLLSVKPFYAGPAFGFPGVDQIGLILPQGVANNCFVPFTVDAGRARSSVYTMSIAGTGGQCSIPFALGREGLETLDDGGSVRITGMTVHEHVAEAWAGEYDAAHLSQLATYDLQPFGADVSCSRRAYGYARFDSPLLTLLPAEAYGLRRVPEAVEPSVSGPGGCAWNFTLASDGVYRAAAPPECPPRNYMLRKPGTVFLSAGNVPFDVPLPPMPPVTFDRVTGAVSWQENFSSRLTLEISSSFTLPGNIFSGQTSVRELSCRLSGNYGAGQLSEADLAWALGLPSNHSIAYRQWNGGLIGGSWGGPDEALFVRILRVQEQSVPENP